MNMTNNRYPVSLLLLVAAPACATSTADPASGDDAALDVVMDATADASRVSQQNICGARTTLWNVGANRALGPFSASLVTRVRTATGVVHWNAETPNSVAQRRYGTGFLIGPRVFITAKHNFDPNIALTSPVPGINSASDICDRTHIDFGFFNQNGSDPVPLVNGHEGASYACERVLSSGVGGHDVAVLLLRGTPGSVYGYLPVATDAPRVGDPVLVVGTPAGLPLMASYGNLLGVEPGTIGYDADTVGGFSGGPVIDLLGRATGVHRAGACDEGEATADRANLATPMHAVLDSDPTLRSLLAGERCGRGAIDCLCAAGSDARAQARCFDTNLDCSRCVSGAIAACCAAEVAALDACTRSAGCNDNTCISARCGAQSDALNRCWSNVQQGNAACLNAFAYCFSMYPLLCG